MTDERPAVCLPLFCLFTFALFEGLARELRVEHGGLVDEGGHDGGGLLHVVRLYALEGVLRRVVRARVVVNRVLYELEAGQADGVEGEVIGSARVGESQGLRAEVCERREPTAEERAHRVVPLHVDAAYSARAVVEVEVGGELFVLRLRR